MAPTTRARLGRFLVGGEGAPAESPEAVDDEMTFII
jgi:hypothetical protein